MKSGTSTTFSQVFITSLTIVLLLNAFFVSAVAQESTPVKKDSIEALQPIATPDIPTEAQKLTIRLREMEKRFGQQTLNDQLDSTFALLAQDIDSLYERFVQTDLNTLSVRSLNDMTNQWAKMANELDEVETLLKDQATAIEAVIQELDGFRDIWELTLKRIREENLTRSPVYPVILESLKAIGDRRNQVQKLRARNLEEQSRVLDKELHITESSEQLQDQIMASQKQLLVQNDAPLWRALYGADSLKRDSLNIRADFDRSWEANGEVVTDYIAENTDGHILAFLAFLIMIGLGYLLRKRSEKWMEDHEEELKPAVKVIHRPVAVAWVLTLLFLAQYIYTNEPISFNNFLILLIIVPIYFIFPSLIHRRYHSICYALLSLFLLVRLYSYIIEDTLTGRLLLLFLTLSSLVLSVWFFRVYSRTPWYVKKRMIGLICAVIFGVLNLVSLVANFIGYTSLAEMLTVASLDSVGAAIVFYTVIQILRGVFKMISLSKGFMNWKTFTENYSSIMKFTYGGLNVFFTLWWLRFALRRFQIYDNVYSGLDSFIFSKHQIGTIEVSVANFLGFFLVIWVAHYVSKIIRALLENDILVTMKLPRGVPGAISIVTRYSILTLGIMLAFGVLGIELSQLTFLVGALGVGIGFGLQNIFNNLVSGLILAFERPVQIGDTIQMGELFGTVREIGIRSSTVRAFSGAEVIVPNGNLISNEVVNWTLSDKTRRIELDVGVEYGTNPHVVIAILEKVANDHPDVFKNPAPQAVFLNFGDSSLNFKLYYWMSNLDRLFSIKSEMYLGVYDALNEAEITIPFPQRDLNIKSLEGAPSKDFVKKNGLKVVDEPDTREEKGQVSEPEEIKEVVETTDNKKKTSRKTSKTKAPELPTEGLDDLGEDDD